MKKIFLFVSFIFAISITCNSQIIIKVHPFDVRGNVVYYQVEPRPIYVEHVYRSKPLMPKQQPPKPQHHYNYYKPHQHPSSSRNYNNFRPQPKKPQSSIYRSTPYTRR